MRKNRYRKRAPGPSGGGLRWAGAVLKLGGMIVLLLSLSALFISGYATVTHTDYFNTQSIQVVGNQRLSVAQIISQAEIRQGDNLLALNLRVIRERLAAHPWIRSAQVTRDIPQTLMIRVEEQAPLAVLDLGRKFLINPQGRIFKEWAEGDPEHLPLITGIGYTDIRLGDDALSPPLSALLEVVEISRAANGAVPYDEIEELRLDQEIGITIVTAKHHRQIKLGFGNFETKNQRLLQILPLLEANAAWSNFHILDANNPDRMVVQLGTTLQTNAQGV